MIMKKIFTNFLRKSMTIMMSLFFILLISYSCNGYGQIAQRGSATNTMVSSPGASFVITKPAGVLSGDIMIINIAQYSSGALSTPVCSGWTAIDGRTLNTTGKYGAVLYKVAGAAEGASYTFTITGAPSYLSATIIAFSGVNPITPFDVTPGTLTVSASGTTCTAASITTLTPNAAVIMLGMSSYNAGTWSAWTLSSPTLTQLYSNPYTSTTYTTTGAAWGIKATPGATGAGSATCSSADYYGGILLALKLAIAPCSTPISLAATASSSSQTSTTINGSFTAAITPPTGYVVVRTATNVQPTLTDGSVYTVGANAEIGRAHV